MVMIGGGRKEEGTEKGGGGNGVKKEEEEGCDTWKLECAKEEGKRGINSLLYLETARLISWSLLLRPVEPYSGRELNVAILSISKIAK